MKRLLALILLLPLGPVVPPPGPPPAAHPDFRVAALPAYGRLLARHVREGVIDGKQAQLVDYAAIRRDPDLAVALDELAAARPATMGEDERLAFWINAYNLLVIRLVADAYPIDTIKDLDTGGHGVFGEVAGKAGGRLVSLDEIENTILRRQFREPRIHFTLVAAAMSCPDLRGEPYDGARIDDQLEDATQAFLANPDRGVRRTRGGVAVSHLFHGFHEDFEREGGIAAFIRAHASPVVASWLEGLDDHDLESLPYDWSLNDRARSSVAGTRQPEPRS